MSDGGPAFPVLDNPGDGALYSRSGGMSLRDYFAAQIASGMAAFSGTAGGSYDPDNIAGRSYEVADALMKRREETNGR